MGDDRLSALDAGFLQTEDADGHVSLAVAALAILEGPPPDFAAVMSTIEDRSARQPRCRQILHTSPLDLTAPTWNADPHFDIAHHVRRTAVPAPGDDTALFGTVADIMERRLDRSRPLWESWVLEGLAEDRWAILTKVHHCVADGVSGTAMLADLCDDGHSDSGEKSSVTESEDEATARGAIEMTRVAWRTLKSVPGTAFRVLTGAAQIAAGLALPPRDVLTGPLSDLRRYSAARVPMTDVRLACNRFDVTVNDVVLAAISDGFRSVMTDHGMRPGAGAIRTLVPVSVRTADALHTPDNRVSLLLPELPVDEPDPIERLRIVHQRLATAKDGGQRQAGSLAVAAANLMPYPVTATAVRLLARLPQRGVVTVATNIPGPRDRQHFMGRDVIELLPVPPIALGLRIGIAIMSYADDLAFGIIGDFDGPLGVEELSRAIERGVTRLTAVAGASRRSRRLGGLLLLSG
jgi:diacylglycerol O-acyltransferase